MTKTTIMEEKLQEILLSYDPGGMKKRDYCIERIFDLFQETIAQAMPEEKIYPLTVYKYGKRKNVPFYYMKIGFNAALDQVKSNLLKAIGKAGEA